MSPYPETHLTWKTGHLGKARREELIPNGMGVFLKTREKEELMISVSGEDLFFPHTQSTRGQWFSIRMPPAEC